MAETSNEKSPMNTPKSENVATPTYGANEAPTDPGDDDYEPYDHKVVDNPTTNFETYVHLLKCTVGTGIMAMPEAFKNAGIVFGSLGTFFVGFICVYALQILLRCMYTICKRRRVPVLSYCEAMRYALEAGPPALRPLAKYSVLFIDVLLIAYQLGICCVYIVFVGSNLKAIFRPYLDIRVELYMLMVLVPFILMNLIRNLKYLAPFSTVANVFTLIGLGIVFYYILTDIPKHNLDYIGSYTTVPLFFGTTLFALNAVGVVVSLEQAMQERRCFVSKFGVLNMGMLIITMLYAIMGFFGYMKYAEDVQGSVTLNLPETPLAVAIKVVYVLAVFISYGLQCYPPVQIIWTSYLLKRLEGRDKLILWEMGLRIGLVLLTFVAAVSIPMLGVFISLVGAVCISLLGVAFPAIMEICVNYPNYGPMKCNLIKNFTLISMGIFVLIVGTASSVREIINELFS